MSFDIAFVQTPMAAAVVPERQAFWTAFDMQYHAAHPGLRHMKKPVWELPHWMHWLAGGLVRDGFNSVRVVDLAWCATGLRTVDENIVAESIRCQPADVYLFSPMTPNLPLALNIAGVIKKLSTTAIVVFGGVVATPLWREVVSDPRVDYVVIGRGEIALTKLLECIRHKLPPDSLGSLAFKSSTGDARRSPWQYPSVAPPALADPCVDLFAPDMGENLRYLRQVFALGCPYSCSFCTIQTIRQPQAFFAVERVLREIHAYRAYYGEHHNIYFGDETFGLNKAHTKELCAALELDGTVKYDCQTRLACLEDADTRSWLRRSGCRWVEIGLETRSQATQDRFKQRQKIAKTRDILERARDDGLATCAFMVNGFPDQTMDDMKESIDWVCELIACRLLRASYFATLVPYPGSELYERAEMFGITIHHREYELYNEDLAPVFDSRFATSDEAYRIFLDGLTMIGCAMAGAMPHPLPLGSDGLSPYGQFWATSHV